MEHSSAWAASFCHLVKDFEALPGTVAGLHLIALAPALMLNDTVQLVASSSQPHCDLGPGEGRRDGRGRSEFLGRADRIRCGSPSYGGQPGIVGTFAGLQAYVSRVEHRDMRSPLRPDTPLSFPYRGFLRLRSSIAVEARRRCARADAAVWRNRCQNGPEDVDFGPFRQTGDALPNPPG